MSLERNHFIASLLYLSLAFVILSLPSCARPLSVQMRVNNLAEENNYKQAVALLNDNPRLYGKNNTLLYLLDKGYILHLAGDYAGSIQAFEEAKKKADELYTRSVSKEITTWLINDYMAPYRGEDFERVLVNIFEAIDYAMLGDIPGALVEARDVDLKLNLINKTYAQNAKNVYREDAFARLLMGILYEAGNTGADLNDAFISYKKAADIYESDYALNYQLSTPRLLKENILSTAYFMGREEFAKYRDKYKDIEFADLKEKNKKAEVYLIQYNGLASVKLEGFLPIPFPNGYVVQFAFPEYDPRFYRIKGSDFTAEGKKGRIIKSETELGEDIVSIAVKNLENRKTRVIAKAVASSALKYVIEQKQGEVIDKKYGDTAGAAYRILCDIFNLTSSRADLRSWQTLPAQIRVARLLLEPGEYDFRVKNLDQDSKVVDEIDLGRVTVGSGEKKFFIIRSVM